MTMRGAAGAATIGAMVRWQPSSGASGYRVYWRPLSVATPISRDVGTPATAADGSLGYLVSGVDSTIDNAFSVSAYTTGGTESLRSSELVLAATPAPGSCTTPTIVPAGGGVVTGVTSGTDGLASSCTTSGGSPERVFAWTPAASGVATLETCSATQTTFDTVLSLRQGSCATGTELACNDDTPGCGSTRDPSNPYHGSRITPTVIAGRTYYVVVDGYAGQQGNFALTITPPTSCANTIVVPSGGGVFGGTTSGTSAMSASCSGSAAAPERVFQWTPAVSGTATIHTCSTTRTTFDTVLYLRQGTCGGGAELACNDDTTGCGITTDGATPRHGSRITPTVTAGQTYFIVVDGYATGAGSFELTVTPPAAAAVAAAAVATSSSTAVCRSAADCPAGDACTEVRCRGGRCTGTPRACGEGRPCEDATCDPSAGCAVRAAADGSDCHATDPCITDVCEGGACVPRADRPAPAAPGHRLTVQRFAVGTRGGELHLAATGWFAASASVDPTTSGAVLELSAPDGRLLHRADVDAARFTANRTRTIYRYVAPRDAAAETNGLTRLVLRRSDARVRVSATVVSTALAAVVEEPTVRWTLRLGDICVREPSLACVSPQARALRCAAP